ncbi:MULTISPECIES: aminotransferase class I/II-fold pyridoxal phosphate-dependent enzyme [Burkholderiaceae]|uniref:aminotransferase class I/II-fold pyridoxal phosphate-dependent enzyme n=1 Tax=Burkholderiaceae TaxID=119060 RepID=UPI001420132A|nr:MULTISPECIES: aminotransferase class I/II-fold pyridoxal phosphate-dependent enzyme [Burkholderiaceae]MBN3846562.1 aminotransferase class I/II-fold pyridoxal phosphate-dependent enzyme [Paraburkholderia sp. Ac-20342]NIF55648.1 aminotransferase class I/II-fold pyridoxal phosphate-dependent enzyme [Burkholderia sp. Ax-1724]NIF77970.1 aminotransferase class I/II-fold pyridoxal phosphate-dependent enzyme [Paraburkholderia sp. Cy-641]
MKLIAARLERIKPSPSSMATARVKELRAAGREIIGLTVGEPDFDTPPHIIEAAYDAMKSGKTRYTVVDGTPELKRAIREKFERENGLVFAQDEVSVGNGGKQVIFNALTCTVDKGDEVIVPAPYWVSYPDMVLLNGGRPVIVECDVGSAYKMTPAQLEAAITPRTKWLVLNSPCNPTGASYTESELAALGEVLSRHPHVWILTDDVYEHLIYDGFKFATFAQCNPHLQERTLTVNGVSKAYAMTGWRIGFAGGPKALIGAMAKLQSQSTTNPSAISQAAALAALTGPKDFLAEWRAQFQRRRDLVVERLNAIDGLYCPNPTGAFYVYPSCAGVIGRRTPDGRVIENDGDFVMYLLETQDVGVIQGAAFGLSPAFRISFATSYEQLQEGCRRIALACESLRA